jgi:hypothetical protein
MGHPAKGKSRGRHSKHWECSSCHYFVPVKDSFCNSCGEFRSVTPSPKGKGRGHEPKGQGRGKQPLPQTGIAERQLRLEREAAAKDKENARLQKEVQRLQAEAKKAVKAAGAMADASATAAPGAAGTGDDDATSSAEAIDKEIQQTRLLLAGIQNLDGLLRDNLYPNEGDYQAKLDDLKRQLHELHAKKRGTLPASQQLQKAQEHADRMAKKLDSAKDKRSKLQQAQMDLQQKLVEADADIVRLTAESEAAAENVRTVSLQAAAAATPTSSQTDAAPVSIVVPNEAAETDPKLRECLEYLNGHKALQSAVLSPSLAKEAVGHRPAGTEAVVEHMVAEGNAAHIAQLQQQLEHFKAQACEVRQLWADIDDDLASDIESSTDQGEQAAVRRQRKAEHAETRKAKRKKLGGVISRFDKS